MFGNQGESFEQQLDLTVTGFLQHVGAYALLGALVSWSFLTTPMSVAVILALCLAHGVVTESIQVFVPNRVADVGDLMGNVLGVVLSVGCCAWLARRRRLRYFPILAGLLALVVSGCGEAGDGESSLVPDDRQSTPALVCTVEWIGQGEWLKIDTHCHTRHSDGAQTIEELATKAVEHGCDAIAVTDHIDRLDAEEIPEYLAEIELVRRQFPELIVIPGLEWNVPPGGGDDHATVLFPDSLARPDVLIPFCEEFDDYGRVVHEASRAVAGLSWLADKAIDHPVPPVVLLNHPCRKFERTDEAFELLSSLQRSSPLVVGFSGAPGHQAGEVIGAYDEGLATVDRWDPVVRPGDVWDRIISSGQACWGALAPSDFHRHGGDEWGDYWPGEFSETWLSVPERTADGVLQALASGTYFSNHGGILRNARLYLNVEGLERPVEAGETVTIAPGTHVELSFVAVAPDHDLFGERNVIDEVEFIVMRGGEVHSAVYQIGRCGEVRASHNLDIDTGRASVRVRCRRVIDEGPDLLSYTNPILVVVDSAAADS